MIRLVVEATLRSCALGLALWLLLTLTRSRNPHLHKLMGAAMLVASLAMPLLMQVRMMPVIHAPDSVLTLQADPVGATHLGAAWNSIDAPYIDALYVLVALALLARYLRSLLTMWHVRRDAELVDYTSLARLEMGSLDVRVTSRVRSPSTFGSTILLPTDFVEWPHQKLTAVLAHERAHVLHKDCYMLWLARLHTCVFWFNPLAWWLQRKLAALSETTSDEAAVQAIGDKPMYAEILLEFAACRAESDVATAMARPHIVTRIERVISEITPSAIPKLSQRILAIAAVLPMVAAAAAPLGQSPVHSTQSGAPPDAAICQGKASQQPCIKTGHPTLAELAKYYPREAARRGIDGLVHIQVTLDTQGHATDTLILSEDPLNMGFGAAASALAHVMEYNNPTDRPAQLAFNVKFALAQPTPSYGTTNFESPDTP
ncbi:MAG TPA: M56 family metallopeptidase [Steroidobacteraceae bacterium]|nr:M56 family metallopeptidase [Steroidobacteraceae bacterium]